MTKERTVWAPVSIEREPITELTHWQVFRAKFPSGQESMHFVGYTGIEGRVSSPIGRWFPTERVGTSRSGRHYRLAGKSGNHPDASWTLDRWLEINNCTFENISQDYKENDND